MNNKDFTCGTLFSDMSNVPEIKLNKTTLPGSFDLRKFTYPVYNQGNRGICCSVSLTDTIKYLENFKRINLNIPRDYFWLQRKDKSANGMTIKEAMNIAKNNGYIKTFGKLKSIDDVKTNLVIHGPVIFALPAYSDSGDYFWRSVGNYRGGHAVVIVGYNKDGFILKNSWGNSWSNNGYILFPYSDFKYVREAWTVFA